MALMEISDIADMLASRIDALCADILPRGRREGKEWVEASRASGGLGNGLKVCLSGARQGVWSHFGDDASARGDALELVAYVLFGRDKKKAIAWAVSWLGIDGADPGRIKQQRQIAREDAKAREDQAKKDIEARQRRARAMWLGSSSRIEGSPVDFYLLGRGIGISDLPRVPGSLRYAPSLRHPDGRDYPAMVAAIHNGAGHFCAVHRTFLAPLPGGGFIKAPLGENAKMVLGPYAGGFITLNRGSSGKPLAEAHEGETVVLCEGIEDGLSIAMACPDLRVLSCISVNNFKNVRLPQAIGTVIIAADNDAPESPAARAVDQAAMMHAEMGREVMIWRSPVGKDFNDCLRALEDAQGAA